MRRVLAGLVATGTVVLAGCSSVSDADGQVCDYLYAKHDSSLDEDVPALRAIVEDLGPVAAGTTPSTVLRPYVEHVVSDARTLVRGGKAPYLDLHVLDTLSVCMDHGW